LRNRVKGDKGDKGDKGVKGVKGAKVKGLFSGLFLRAFSNELFVD